MPRARPDAGDPPARTRGRTRRRCSRSRRPPSGARGRRGRRLRLLRHRADGRRADRGDRAARGHGARAPAVGRPRARSPPARPRFLDDARRIGAQDGAARRRHAHPRRAARRHGRRPGRRPHRRDRERRDLRVAHVAAPDRGPRPGHGRQPRRLHPPRLRHRAPRRRRGAARRRLGPLRLDAAARRRRRAPARRRRCRWTFPPTRSRCGSATRTRATRPRRWSTLEHGPRMQSVAPTGDNGSLPLHQAVDAAGDHWISLSGADALVHLTPGRRPVEEHPDRRAHPRRQARPERSAAGAPAHGRRRRSRRHGVDHAHARQRHRAHRPVRRPGRHDGRRARVPAPRLRRRRVQGRLPARAGHAPVAPAAADEGHRGRRRQHARLVHRAGRGAHRPAARRPRRHRARPDATSAAAASRRSASRSTRRATCGSPRA